MIMRFGFRALSFFWVCGTAFLILGSVRLAYGTDKSGTYQLGTYLTASAVSDGTVTDNFNCGSETLGSTVCSGGIHANGVIVYRIKVPGGVWSLETMRQAEDSAQRRILGDEPLHFKSEKENPLDLLKNGDKVLFRVEEPRKLLGVEVDVFVPFADNPNKEAKFVGSFISDVLPVRPKSPSDNVRAMCDAHKLSPELEKQLCTPASASASPSPSASQQGPIDSGAVNSILPPVARPEGADVSPDPQRLAQMAQDGQASRCSVFTVPPGAEVYVDGKRVGAAPMVFVLLRHGDTPRVVTVKLDGYRTVEKQFIPDGKFIPVGLVLEKE